MTIPAFDAVAASLAETRLAVPEEEALKPLWDAGEDAWLREDPRFRPTPWGLWTLSERFVANEYVYRELRRGERPEIPLDEALAFVEQLVHLPCAFCPGDPRFKRSELSKGVVRLAASELGDEILVETEVGDLQRYRTHLPLYSLKAMAASEPAGEWGDRAQHEVIEPLGWVRVDIPGRSLSDRMCLARVVGDSMDDGRRGILDGRLAVFELWPSGTKQGLIVLARWSRHASDAAGYAIKKYDADTRDADGRHHRISLVSLNLDKDRFPDIQIRAEDEHDFDVVAKWVAMLADPPRKPRDSRTTGRRGLDSPATRVKVFHRARAAIDSFFGPPTPGKEPPARPRAEREGWLECAPEGLRLRFQGFEDLPPAASRWKVQVESGPLVREFCGHDLRAALPLAVPPSSAPYRLVCGNLDDDETPPDIPGLEPSRVTVFKVDSSGTGQRTAAALVREGARWRLLVPPGLDVPREEVVDLGQGWSLWDLDLAERPGPDLTARILSLGLTLEGPGVDAWFTIRPASRYETSPRGETFPVFASGELVILRVAGPACLYPGEIRVFLVSPSKTDEIALEGAGPWNVAWTAEPGRAVVEVLHERTRLDPVRLFFSAEPPESRRGPPVKVAIGGKPLDFPCLEAVSGMDIGAGLPLEVRLPPLWPVHARWKVLEEEWLGRLQAGANGNLEVSDVLDVLGERPSSTIGDLILDVPELGRIRVQHDREMDPATALERLHADKASDVPLIRTEGLLTEDWLEPLLGCLGVIPERLPPIPDVRAVGYRCVRLARQGDGIEAPVEHVVVVVDPAHLSSDQGNAWADAFAVAQGRDLVIVTDGERWRRRRRGGRYMARLVETTTPGGIESFLADIWEAR